MSKFSKNIKFLQILSRFMKKILAVSLKIFSIFNSSKMLCIFFVLLIFLISCSKNINKNFSEILINNGKNLIKINIEIADDNEKRMKGLMFREKLNENEGMLFVFDDEQYQTFWMKNTLIPLDIIFIDKNLKIVDIKNAVPCKEEPCVIYKSEKAAEYVLEVNKNFTIKKGIKVGDNIIITQ